MCVVLCTVHHYCLMSVYIILVADRPWCVQHQISHTCCLANKVSLTKQSQPAGSLVTDCYCNSHCAQTQSRNRTSRLRDSSPSLLAFLPRQKRWLFCPFRSNWGITARAFQTGKIYIKQPDWHRSTNAAEKFEYFVTREHKQKGLVGTGIWYNE